MIDRTFVEKFLTANGVSPTGPDEEIKSVLVSAKWHKDDVDTALMVLREDTKTQVQRVDSLHKVYNSDSRLSPDTITSLLGIDVDVSDIKKRNDSTRGAIFGSSLVIIFLALLFAASFILFVMWNLKMGIFYEA